MTDWKLYHRQRTLNPMDSTDNFSSGSNSSVGTVSDPSDDGTAVQGTTDDINTQSNRNIRWSPPNAFDLRQYSHISFWVQHKRTDSTQDFELSDSSGSTYQVSYSDQIENAGEPEFVQIPLSDFGSLNDADVDHFRWYFGAAASGDDTQVTVDSLTVGQEVEMADTIEEVREYDLLSLTTRRESPDLMPTVQQELAKISTRVNTDGAFTARDISDNYVEYLLTEPTGRSDLREGGRYFPVSYEEEPLDQQENAFEISIEWVPEYSREPYNQNTSQTASSDEWLFEFSEGTIATKRVAYNPIKGVDKSIRRAEMELVLTHTQAKVLEESASYLDAINIREIPDGANKAEDTSTGGRNTVTITAPESGDGEGTLPGGTYAIESWETEWLNDAYVRVSMETMRLSGSVIRDATHYYDFDKNLLDSIGTLHGTQKGNIDWTKDNIVGDFAGVFNAGQDINNEGYIELGDRIVDPNNDFSIWFWLFGDQTGNDGYIVDQYDGTEGFFIWYSDSTTTGSEGMTFTMESGEVNTSWNPGNRTDYTFFCIVHKANPDNRIEIYKRQIDDGVSVFVEDNGSTTGAGAAATTIASDGGSSAFYDGLMDGLGAVDRALSSAEVDRLYEPRKKQ